MISRLHNFKCAYMSLLHSKNMISFKHDLRINGVRMVNMDVETIIDIVLSIFLGSAHLLFLLVSLTWRHKKYQKFLHNTWTGIISFLLSFCFGVLLPIAGFVFLDNGEAGTKMLIIGSILCPLFLLLSIHNFCFCIYIEGNLVIKKTLFTAVRIDISKVDSVVEKRPVFGDYAINIISANGDCIQFFKRTIEGDVQLFLKECYKIQKAEKNKNNLQKRP